MNQDFINEVRPIIALRALESTKRNIEEVPRMLEKLIEEIRPIARRYGVKDSELLSYIQYISEQGT